MTQRLTRRCLLQTAAATAALLPLTTTSAQTPRHNRIHQSVSRWCYQKIPLDTLCKAAADIGLKGIDLLNLDEWEIPKRYGLVCTMGYAGGGRD